MTPNDIPSGAEPLTHETIERAAHAIVDKLPKHIGEVVREAAYIYNRQPLWSLIAGHLLKAYETGDLYAPITDPAWMRDYPREITDPRPDLYKCLECGESFTPIRYKQQYCSQDCGHAANRKAQELERAAAPPPFEPATLDLE